jgi:hypothetical protein
VELDRRARSSTGAAWPRLAASWPDTHPSWDRVSPLWRPDPHDQEFALTARCRPGFVKTPSGPSRP